MAVKPKPTTKPCPTCGYPVPKADSMCPKCGHRF